MARKRVTEKEIVVSAPVSARHKPATTTRANRASSAPKPTAVVTQSMPVTPSREDVARLAYSYWEARGYQGGSPEADWLLAEQKLTA